MRLPGPTRTRQKLAELQKFRVLGDAISEFGRNSRVAKHFQPGPMTTNCYYYYYYYYDDDHYADDGDYYADDGNY